MKFSNPFKCLEAFEWGLWSFSVIAVTLSFLLGESRDILTLIASLIGATALIFVAKGHIFGQIVTVIFSLFYGYISFATRYYGEMITYMFMTAPMAVIAIYTWAKHPSDKGNEEVAVADKLKPRQIAVMLILTAAVTAAFYFILKALGNASLIVSTISVTTSFLACYLTALRSPFYALGYAANDIVLIILWVIASLSDSSYIPMVACFVIFLINDLYGFFNWRRMKRRQLKLKE